MMALEEDMFPQEDVDMEVDEPQELETMNQRAVEEFFSQLK